MISLANVWSLHERYRTALQKIWQILTGGVDRVRALPVAPLRVHNAALVSGTDLTEELQLRFLAFLRHVRPCGRRFRRRK